MTHLLLPAVTVTVGQPQYALGEPVDLTITNSSEVPIYTYYNCGEPLVWWVNGNWINPLVMRITEEWIPAQPLAPGESWSCTWQQESYDTLSYSDNLLLRAADVTLKDRRRLVLVTRETPLHLGHLRHMVQVAEMGAIVLPPVPAFYHRPQSLQAIVDQTVNLILNIFEIELPADLFRRWTGPEKKPVLVQERTTLATPAGDRNSGQRH